MKKEKKLVPKNIFGKMTCLVCGFEFHFDLEKHYISRDETDVGFGAIVTTKAEPCLYDTVDCPACGCQHVLQKRKRKMEEEA